MKHPAGFSIYIFINTTVTFIKVPLGDGRYAELTEWNGSKRVDLRFWKTDTIPTKVGIITTVESLVQCYANGGRFDQLSERRRTRVLEI